MLNELLHNICNKDINFNSISMNTILLCDFQWHNISLANCFIPMVNGIFLFVPQFNAHDLVNSFVVGEESYDVMFQICIQYRWFSLWISWSSSECASSFRENRWWIFSEYRAVMVKKEGGSRRRGGGREGVTSAWKREQVQHCVCVYVY